MYKFTAVSLFSGAGGLDLGLEAAGWNILAQVEMDLDSVGSLKHHAESRGLKTEIIPHPIEATDPHTLRKGLGLQKGELALLAGGPPCQPFTTTGSDRPPTIDGLLPSSRVLQVRFRIRTKDHPHSRTWTGCCRQPSVIVRSSLGGRISRRLNPTNRKDRLRGSSKDLSSMVILSHGAC